MEKLSPKVAETVTRVQILAKVISVSLCVDALRKVIKIRLFFLLRWIKVSSDLERDS